MGPGSAPCSIRVGSPAPLTEPIWGLQEPEAEGQTCSWTAGQGPEPAACEGPRQTHPSLLLTLRNQGLAAASLAFLAAQGSSEAAAAELA